jgi:hypothetical protein
VFEFSLSNPPAIAVDYTFTFTNGTAGSADYYHFANSNCTCGCYYGNCGITADTIAESMRPLLLPLERFGYWNQ